MQLDWSPGPAAHSVLTNRTPGANPPLQKSEHLEKMWRKGASISPLRTFVEIVPISVGYFTLHRAVYFRGDTIISVILTYSLFHGGRPTALLGEHE